VTLMVILGGGLVPSAAMSHHPEFKPPKKVIIHCVDTDNALNHNLRQDPTSRRAGEDGEILFQYQLCRSA
jgi:hypothetical protein